jgi:hypothetical protein
MIINGRNLLSYGAKVSAVLNCYVERGILERYQVPPSQQRGKELHMCYSAAVISRQKNVRNVVGTPCTQKLAMIVIAHESRPCCADNAITLSGLQGHAVQYGESRQDNAFDVVKSARIRCAI